MTSARGTVAAKIGRLDVTMRKSSIVLPGDTLVASMIILIGLVPP